MTSPCRRSWHEVIGLVAAGATGAVIVLAARGMADVGDLLGFVGAAVGAILTVGGALWVERRRQAELAAVTRVHGVECLRRVEELAARVTDCLIGLDDTSRRERYSFIIEIESAFREMETIMRIVIEHGFVSGNWSLRAAVDIEVLKARADEGVHITRGRGFIGNDIFADADRLKQYRDDIEYCASTTLVLVHRVLADVGEPYLRRNAVWPPEMYDDTYAWQIGPTRPR